MRAISSSYSWCSNRATKTIIQQIQYLGFYKRKRAACQNRKQTATQWVKANSVTDIPMTNAHILFSLKTSSTFFSVLWVANMCPSASAPWRLIRNCSSEVKPLLYLEWIGCWRKNNVFTHPFTIEQFTLKQERRRNERSRHLLSCSPLSAPPHLHFKHDEAVVSLLLR